jgi:hypothetical protein
VFVTAPAYEYTTMWLSTLGQESVVFKVAACKEANIALAQYPGITGTRAYEVGEGTVERPGARFTKACGRKNSS